LALAFLPGFGPATRRARCENISSDAIGDVTLWIMVGAFSVRHGYVTTYWKDEFAASRSRKFS